MLPGPGKYLTIDQLGDKYFTKSKNGGVRSFHGRQRFKKGIYINNEEKITPGPSDYCNKTIEPDGFYFLSTMKGSGRRTILDGKRKLKVDGNK